MEHEITYRIKNDVLGKTFRNSHRLSFLFFCVFFTTSCWATSIFFITPQLVLECFAPHKVRSFVKNLFILVFLFFCCFTLLFFFLLDSFLKSLVQNFLQNTFPNIFFLPYAMIVDILGQVVLLQITFVFYFVCRYVFFVW